LWTSVVSQISDSNKSVKTGCTSKDDRVDKSKEACCSSLHFLHINYTSEENFASEGSIITQWTLLHILVIAYPVYNSTYTQNSV
jgi:hypothetical protein